MRRYALYRVPILVVDVFVGFQPSQKKWVKPTPNTKKADSSSNSKRNTNTGETWPVLLLMK